VILLKAFATPDQWLKVLFNMTFDVCLKFNFTLSKLKTRFSCQILRLK